MVRAIPQMGGVAGGRKAAGNRERNRGGVWMNEAGEIETFKRDIDLRQFAASLGYEMDRRDSWRGSTVMRRGADKIVVKRNRNHHYVYFSVRDDRDNGTIIDFLQRRQKLSLGAVRQALRPWIGHPVAGLPAFPQLEPTSQDRMRVEGQYRLRMALVLRHPYLEHERGLPAAVLASRRFAGRVRMDASGNAVFPHFDQEGLCGYEIKNTGFTGFAAGGTKGLWFSHSRSDDRRLVLTESAIDALSHATLFPDAADQTRYASLGGKLNSQQPDLVKANHCEAARGVRNRSGVRCRRSGAHAGGGGPLGCRGSCYRDRKDGLDFQRSPSDAGRRGLEPGPARTFSKKGETTRHRCTDFRIILHWKRFLISGSSLDWKMLG